MVGRDGLRAVWKSSGGSEEGERGNVGAVVDVMVDGGGFGML